MFKALWTICGFWIDGIHNFVYIFLLLYLLWSFLFVISFIDTIIIICWTFVVCLRLFFVFFFSSLFYCWFCCFRCCCWTYRLRFSYCFLDNCVNEFNKIIDDRSNQYQWYLCERKKSNFLSVQMKNKRENLTKLRNILVFFFNNFNTTQCKIYFVCVVWHGKNHIKLYAYIENKKKSHWHLTVVLTRLMQEGTSTYHVDVPKSIEHSRKTKRKTSRIHEWIYWMNAICNKNFEHLAGDVDLFMTHLFRGEIVCTNFRVDLNCFK